MFQLLNASSAFAQGTTYLSNLDAASAGSQTIASDAWVAAWFETPSGSDVYSLDSIQLLMNSPSGNPSGFSLVLYNPFMPLRPENILTTLSGSEPSSPGIFTYTASGVSLLPATVYWFAVTGGTPAGAGGYQWNYADTVSLPVKGWFQGDSSQFSADGINWGRGPAHQQFAINATAIPEPSTLALVGLAGFCLVSASMKRRGSSVS